MYETIPAELCELKQWVIYLKNKGKIPIQPFVPFRAAKTNEPGTWGSFETCKNLVETGQADGIGFVFTKQDMYVGWDFDDCFQNGELTENVRKKVDFMSTYTELSLSGGGLHLIAKVQHKTGLKAIKEKGLEFYPFGRWFLLTGNVYNDYCSIADLTLSIFEQFPTVNKEYETKFTEIDEGKIFAEGERNNALISFAGLLRSKGLGQKTIYDILQVFNSRHCQPPLEDREIQQISKSIIRYTPKEFLNKPTKEQKEKNEVQINEKGYLCDIYGKLKKGTHNTKILLEENKLTWKIEFDEFKENIYINGREINDEIVTQITAWIEFTSRVAPWPRETVSNVIVEIAKYNVINPVKTWLSTLKWDGIERIRFIAEDIFDLPLSDYHILVFQAFLIQAVARIMQPGCKADQILLLIGPQNCGKSTFARELAPQECWYTDFSMANLHDKDGMIALRGNWIIELSELSAMARSTIESMKAFITRQVDEYRPPYARCSISKKRMCVFIGTTNDDTPLKDQTGNRRFLIINLPKDCKINIENLKRQRKQLWAEAVELYKKGITYYFYNEEAIEHQNDATETDIFQEYLDMNLNGKNSVTLAECANLLKLDAKDMDKSKQIRIGLAMRRLGWHKEKTSIWVDGQSKKIMQFVKDD